MNKLLFVLAIFASISLVFAAGTNVQQGLTVDVQAGSGSGSDNVSGVEVETQLATQNQGEQTQLQNQVQAQVQTGTYMNQEGQQMQIQAGVGNEVKIQSGNMGATTTMNMTQEQVQNRTKLQVKLSNGLNAEVKIMPDSASTRAQEVLGAKCEERNCTIELKEVGTGNQTRAVYEIKTQKESRVLGLFKAQMQVQAQIDAENGEVVQSKKPWWAFLATE